MKGSDKKTTNKSHSANLLWAEIKKKNKEAFTELYNLISADLFSYGYKLLQNSSTVEDCIQELFIDIWKKRNNLPNPESVYFFLLQSLRKKLLMAIRSEERRKKREEVSNSFDLDFFLDVSYEKHLIQHEANLEVIQKIEQALNQLTPRSKEIIYLRYYNKMDYSQIAQTMSITVKSAHNLLYESLKQLRAILDYKEFTLLILLLSLSY